VTVETLDPTRTSISDLEAMQADGIQLSAKGMERLTAARQNAEFQASEADGRKKVARKRINKAVAAYEAARDAAIEAIDALGPLITAAQDARVEMNSAFSQGRVEDVAGEYIIPARKEAVLLQRATTDEKEVVRVVSAAMRSSW
jgi:hypothetical protein